MKASQANFGDTQETESPGTDEIAAQLDAEVDAAITAMEEELRAALAEASPEINLNDLEQEMQAALADAEPHSADFDDFEDLFRKAGEQLENELSTNTGTIHEPPEKRRDSLKPAVSAPKQIASPAGAAPTKAAETWQLPESPSLQSQPANTFPAAETDSFTNARESLLENIRETTAPARGGTEQSLVADTGPKIMKHPDGEPEWKNKYAELVKIESTETEEDISYEVEEPEEDVSYELEPDEPAVSDDLSSIRALFEKRRRERKKSRGKPGSGRKKRKPAKDFVKIVPAAGSSHPASGDLVLRCPNCRHVFTVGRDKMEIMIACPQCNTNFKVRNKRIISWNVTEYLRERPEMGTLDRAMPVDVPAGPAGKKPEDWRKEQLRKQVESFIEGQTNLANAFKWKFGCASVAAAILIFIISGGKAAVPLIAVFLPFIILGGSFGMERKLSSLAKEKAPVFKNKFYNKLEEYEYALELLKRSSNPFAARLLHQLLKQ